MSVVESFGKKGTGTRVSTARALEEKDKDWVPSDEEDAATKKKQKASATSKKSQKASSGSLHPADEAGDALAEEPPRPAGSKKAKEKAKEPARARAAGSSADAKTDGSPGKAASASRKQPKRAPSPEPPQDESEDEDEDEVGAARPAGRGGEAEASGARKGEGRRKYSRRFQKDLPQMLYGFGDVRTPLPQTVQVMEDLVVDYVTQILRKASAAAEERARSTRSGGTSRIKERDLLFVLRKDRKRLHRVLELLEVFEEQKQARGNQQPEELAKSLDKPDA